MNLNNIPACLRERHQWVLWKLESRAEGEKPTKVPYQVNGRKAKADDPQTWTTFEAVCEVHARGGYSGIGYEFAVDDPFTGIDLDGCRDPETGRVAEWARQIVIGFETYAEVSPSQTGIKLWIVGKSPFEKGRQVAVEVATDATDATDAKPLCKEPAIEVYDHARYFAMTGMRLTGPEEPQERQDLLEKFCKEYFGTTTPPAEQQRKTGADWHSDAAVIERARKYVAKMPPAISGQKGHNQTFRVACVLVLGFALSESDALALLGEYNSTCSPPWSDSDLSHKIRSAVKQPGERGYLRNATPDRWSSINVPEYRDQPPTQESPRHEPRTTTLVAAARSYLDSIRDGQSPLIETGIADLDYAIGGGVERGELILLGARPSHGKSAVGLQCVHHWTSCGLPCAIISEEMSAVALGKRTLQFVSPAPQDHWTSLTSQLSAEVDEYAATHAPCIVLEGCGDVATTVRVVEDAIEQHKIQCLVVDYAQLLRGIGKTRYEQVTNVSTTLRHLATKHKLVLLALCQLSRDIESRAEFVPHMSDLKESGQFEQDADVIIFCVWPWRIDQSVRPDRYQFFVEKNRNRAINQRGVDCSFDAARQMVSMSTIASLAGGKAPFGTARF